MTRFRFLFFSFLVILCFTQCEKDAFDYRNPYIGDWKFDVVRTEFNMAGIGYYSSDTSEYNGEIKYGGERNILLIKYGIDAEMEVAIDEDGNMVSFSYGRTSGSFEGYEELNIYADSGGLGGGVRLSIRGTRK